MPGVAVYSEDALPVSISVVASVAEKYVLTVIAPTGFVLYGPMMLLIENSIFKFVLSEKKGFVIDRLCPTISQAASLRTSVVAVRLHAFEALAVGVI